MNKYDCACTTAPLDKRGLVIDTVLGSLARAKEVERIILQDRVISYIFQDGTYTSSCKQTPEWDQIQIAFRALPNRRLSQIEWSKGGIRVFYHSDGVLHGMQYETKLGGK